MNNNQKGFTLIEVMVALVIVVVSIVGLMKATAQSAVSVEYFKNKTLAMIVASNLAVDVRLYIKPNIGYIDKKYKMAGKEWPYRIRTIRKKNLLGDVTNSEILVYTDIDAKNNKQHLAQIEVILEAPPQTAKTEENVQ